MYLYSWAGLHLGNGSREAKYESKEWGLRMFYMRIYYTSYLISELI